MGGVGPAGRSYRQPPLVVLRAKGEPTRGIGLSNSGAAGPPPPTANGAISSAQRLVHGSLGASPLDRNPGAQGTAANPPRGRTIDLRA